MKPPCEVMVRRFLTPVRALVAHRLREEGLEQQKIATYVGVTQASVSNYLAQSKVTLEEKLSAFGINREEADAMAAELARAVRQSDSLATEVLYTYWRSVAASGRACEVHRADVGGLTNCDMCLRIMAENPIGGEKAEVIRKIREAIQIIETSPDFGQMIPEVYSNIAYCTKDAKRTEDVAAIPGRIVRFRGRAKAFAQPEFGSSGYLSRLLLALRRNNPWVRSVLNTKLDTGYLHALEAFVNSVPITLDSYTTAEELMQKLESITLSPPIAVLVDPGSAGYEANIYLVGEDPISMTSVAVSASTLRRIR
jgi:predicted fused transcriptional regulator/phosphomethylpyrimidine kinase/predicted transcriptional regulator